MVGFRREILPQRWPNQISASTSSRYGLHFAPLQRWHRTAWRHYWTWRSRWPSGRPRITAEVRDLIQRLARDNPRWGGVRIQGELRKLGIAVSARSVRRYRRRVKRPPPSQSWRSFLRNHAPQIWAADFLTVQTLAFHTLYVFFFVTHERRRVVHLNVTAHPTAEWAWCQLIAATPWGEQPRYLVRDRDRTLRRECLDHLIIFNERHLLRLLRENVAHYNAGRPHRALELDPPSGAAHLALVSGSRIIARPVLGGLLYEYERQAA